MPLIAMQRRCFFFLSSGVMFPNMNVESQMEICVGSFLNSLSMKKSNFPGLSI